MKVVDPEGYAEAADHSFAFASDDTRYFVVPERKRLLEETTKLSAAAQMGVITGARSQSRWIGTENADTLCGVTTL